MQAITQRIAGEILLQDVKKALLLREIKPTADAPDPVYLRFALITRGPADHIFPALVLDDWGRELRSIKLYSWLRENGDRFPRAEVFGFEADGSSTQAFLRGLELQARFPCYAYQNENLPVNEGHLLSAVLRRDATVTRPQRIKRPADIKGPLRDARLAWWLIPEEWRDIDLMLLDAEPDPGY